MKEMKHFDIRHARRAAFFFMTLLLAATYALADNPEDNTYPTNERLFYISRSLNRNLVCYDANLKDGKLDTHIPINAYWVNREEHPGETTALSYFQKKMAYGYKLLAEGDDCSEVSLTAYAGKTLKICLVDGKYVCTTTISGKAAILQSIYVKSSKSNPLSVEYVELRGISRDGGEPLTEKVSK